MKTGDIIKLSPITGKAKQVIHRDGCCWEVIGFAKDVFFSEEKDWIELRSLDNPNNGRWIKRNNDKNFTWEVHL